jgi:hypothetical protein
VIDAAAQELRSASVVALMHRVTQCDRPPAGGVSTRTAHGMHHATAPGAFAAQSALAVGPAMAPLLPVPVP